MDKMKVLIIGDLNSPHSIFRAKLISKFAEVFIITFEKSNEYSYAKIFRIPRGCPHWLKIIFSTFYIIFFKVFYKDGMVHCFGAYHGYLTSIISISRKIIVTCMGSDILTTKGFSHRIFTPILLKNADLVTVKSSNLYEKAIELGASKYRTIPLMWGLEESFAINQPLDTGHLKKSPFVIASHRGCNEIYQNEIIIEGFFQFLRNNPTVDAELWILEGISSDKVLLKNLWNQIETLSIASRVKIIPAIPKDQMYDIYLNSDVVISNPKTDGYPQSIIETAALGVWHIVPDFKQYSDIQEIENLIYSDGTSPSIAMAIETVVDRIPPKKFSTIEFNSKQLKIVERIYSNNEMSIAK